MKTNRSSPRFLLLWILAFLSFPIAGLLANLMGAVTTPGIALLAGLIAGGTLGGVQWLVLRSQLALSRWWILATAVGMAAGLALGTAFLGSETAGGPLLWRAAITGLCIGVAQWLLLRQVLPQSIVWIGVITLGWTLGWFITRGAGIDLSYKWAVFGASGALTFQALTGLALTFLLRPAVELKR
ncbi:MAG TPA: hypothetical protein VFY26_03490 [Anaerolineales bacterium]|nr:hypothetical protein [Anaerolineales bacterium]